MKLSKIADQNSKRTRHESITGNYFIPRAEVDPRTEMDPCTVTIRQACTL